MPVPTLITELSTTAASNYPAGTDSPATLDDVQRAHGAFIAQIRDGVQVTNASAKTTPVDADYLPINDSAASNLIKKVTWANIKATLKTYFDTRYASVGAFAASGANADITSLTALTAGGLPDNSVLTADIANANVTPAKLSQPFTSGTAVATTSGTSIDFTGIPSWVKRVTFSLNGVSTSGASGFQLQVGSGSVVNTGYIGYANYFTTNSVVGGQFSTGLNIVAALVAAAAHSGRATFTLVGSNTWVGDSACSGDASNAANFFATCKIALGGALDRIRLTTINGTDTFDAGSVNILYE